MKDLFDRGAIALGFRNRADAVRIAVMAVLNILALAALWAVWAV